MNAKIFVPFLLVAGPVLIALIVVSYRYLQTQGRYRMLLRLADPTQQIVDASRAARRTLVSELLEELDNDQIDSLTKGLEVLNTVTRRLQERGS